MTFKLLFVSSNDTGEERDMYLKSEKIVVILDSNMNLFEKMEESGFIFDYVNCAFYQL